MSPKNKSITHLTVVKKKIRSYLCDFWSCDFLSRKTKMDSENNVNIKSFGL